MANNRQPQQAPRKSPKPPLPISNTNGESRGFKSPEPPKPSAPPKK